MSLFVAVVLLLGGCTDDASDVTDTVTGPDIQGACTLIGCASGVFWRIDESVSAEWPRPLVFEGCIDDRCDTKEITAEQIIGPHHTKVGLYDGIDLGADHIATARVTGPDGTVLLEREDMVTLSSFQPNGPSCPPTCWQATIHVDSIG